MPNPEGEQPDMHANHLEPTALPARVEDDTHRVLVSKTDSGVLFVRARKGEQPLFSVAGHEIDSVQVLLHSQQQALAIPPQESIQPQDQARPLASLDTPAH